MIEGSWVSVGSIFLYVLAFYHLSASIFGSFSYRGHPFLVFELLDCNVKQLVVKNNQECLSLYLTQQLFRDILECLHHVHTRGWVHADLKPANVMWSPQEGCWKVIDFGHSFQEGHQVRLNHTLVCVPLLIHSI